MIIGKLEVPEKLLIYRASGSYGFKEKESTKPPLHTETTLNVLYRTNSLSSKRKTFGSSCEVTSVAEKSNLRLINQQIAMQQLRLKQAEQLKPFFLTKSRFLAKDGSAGMGSSNTALLKRDKIKATFTLNSATKNEFFAQNDDYEEAANSVKKCNDWLDKYFGQYSSFKYTSSSSSSIFDTD
jgi:hypothetical protein